MPEGRPASPTASPAPAEAAPFAEEPSSPRARAPLTILQINDVYSTLPVDGLGGLARVATLKAQLAKAGRTPLLVIAGDFLSPSVASSVFKGEQMVAALNAAGLDLATLGNHEFDFGVDVLLQRMKESRWQWVVSNVVDAAGQPIGGAAPYVVRSFGSLKVGFIGLCLTSEQISADRLGGVRLIDPYDAAARYLPMLRAEKVDAVVALTHLTIAEDRLLAERFPEIDVIVGGHEHYPLTVSENRTLISKAGSDARYVARIDLNRRGSVLERYFELVPMTGAFADEPRTAEVVASYEKRLGTELDTVVATSAVDLDAEELRLRASETNLGSVFADAMRASVGADVAMMNAGSIRGDRIYPAGPVSRRTLLAAHPFGNVVTKVEIPGRVLLQALTFGVSRLPATSGGFPQVSGLTMRVDLRGGDRVRDVLIGGRPLDPERIYSLALPDYVLAGGDGYAMFAGLRVLIGRESGELIVSAIEKYLAARREVPVPSPGRITIDR